VTITPNTTSHSDPITVSDLVRHPRDGQTELFLVRHGRTIANVRQQFVGATDVPLDDLGERQAALVASRFAGIPIDALVTSPLSRARRTAERISEVTGKSPIVVPGLSEIDFGEIEGLTLNQVLQQFPEMREQLEDFRNLELYWPGGESRRGFATRIMTTFLGLIDRYENQAVAAVCHGGVIGAFCAQLGVGPQDDALRWAVANCSVTHVVVTPEHTRLEMWNDITHLDDVLTGRFEANPTLQATDS
jgi:broad specificity phosphatase PhoE